MREANSLARIRTIKPEFWTDEKLVELEFVDRLMFIGLFNFVDDQGFIDYKPKRIKMQVFPGDDVDVSAALMRLHEASLIQAYDSGDGVVLHITNWEKHQRVPHPSRERYSLSDLRKCNPFTQPLMNPHEAYCAEGKGREVEGKGTSSSEVADAPSDQASRPDVDALCARLAAGIEANGSKKPTITQKWKDAARLMLDKDGRTYEQIVYLIDWSQNDEFWRANVLSMPKLREKFDQLRIKATSPRQTRSGDIDWDAAAERARIRDGESA